MPHAPEVDVGVGGHAERLDVGLTEPSPQGVPGLDGVPESLRAALRHRKKSIVTQVQSCGEPAAVDAAPGQLRAAEWAQETTQAPAGQVELRHESKRGVVCHKSWTDGGGCPLRVALVKHLVPGLTIAVRAVQPGPQGINAPGRFSNVPSTTSPSIPVNRSSDPARLPHKSTTMAPPGESCEIHADGMWSVAAVTMFWSNGAAGALGGLWQHLLPCVYGPRVRMGYR